MLEFWNVRQIKASRKPGKCFLCRGTIELGDPYTRYSGKYEGEFFDNKFHIECFDLVNNYCFDENEDEWDHDAVSDWITDTACRGCENYDDGDCERNNYRCDLALRHLNIIPGGAI